MHHQPSGDTRGSPSPADSHAGRWDFFIAYASADRSVAEELFDLLARGSRVFLDSKTLRPGENWTEVVQRGVESSSTTLILISENSDKAYYQKEEVALAIELARNDCARYRVIPIYLQGPAGLPRPHYGLRGKHSLYVNEETSLARIADSLIELKNEQREQRSLSSLRLRINSRDGTTKYVETGQRLVTIGRDPQSAVHLEDREVSWEHGHIVLKLGGYYYEHLSSTNPAILRRKGDERLLSAGSSEEVRLANQDRLLIGNTKIIIEFDLVSESSGYTTTARAPEDE